MRREGTMLTRNNNRAVIPKVAKSNLKGNRIYTFFSAFTIVLAIALLSGMILTVLGMKTAQRRILDQMQHVMFMDLTEEQYQKVEADERNEVVLRYKPGIQYKDGDLSYSLGYAEESRDGITTYDIKEGKPPKKEAEAVVDASLLKAFGKPCKVGETITLERGGQPQTFVISGYTESDMKQTIYPVWVSKAFADADQELGAGGYYALTKIRNAKQMNSVEFQNLAFKMGEDYGLEAGQVNINGKFVDSLRSNSTTVIAMAVISIIICLASAIVIYSIFYLSVSGRVRQIGQLLTIGMTQKQIRGMIRREGWYLSACSIPVGFLIGLAVAVIIKPDGFELGNTLLTFGGMAVFGAVVVQISIGKPAKVASRISPIEASRSADAEEKEGEKPKKHKPLNPYVLARMGQMRGKKKAVLATISLAFGGILFMGASTYLASWDTDAYARQGGFEDCDFHISYDYDARSKQDPYGVTKLQMTDQLNEELRQKVLAIPHVKEAKFEEKGYGMLEFGEHTNMRLAFDTITREELESNPKLMELGLDYDELTEKNSLICYMPDLIEEVYNIKPKAKDPATLVWYDGTEKKEEVEIAASGDFDLPRNGDTFVMTEDTMKKLWGDINTNANLKVSIEDYDKNQAAVEQQLKALLAEYPHLDMSTLEEEKLATEDQVRQLSIMIYGIAAFVITFSILNLVNTIINSIMTRRRELSMLESIGMEEKQLRKMLLWESLLLVLPNILITLTVGTAVGYGVIWWFQKIASYMKYEFPWVGTLCYVGCVLILPMFVAWLCLKVQSRRPLVERISVE